MGDLVIRRADLGGPEVFDIRISSGRVSVISAEIDVGTEDHVFDAKGGAVLPGLHDHHVHLYAAAAARQSIPVGPPEVNDTDQLGAALRRADRSLPDDAWIRAVGYHESVGGFLDRHDLDRFVPHRPIRVQHRSGSHWFLNSK
ncbi:MAG: amidohydrolase family protein, partial [Acidimicrobiales bacterium]